VDVYKLGVYADPKLDAAIMKSKGLKGVEIIDKLAQSEIKGTSLSLQLKFVRNVGTATIVQAMADGLSKKPLKAEVVTAFTNSLTTAVGKNGINANESIEFLFVDKSKLVIFVRGVQYGEVDDLPLRQALLSIYLDDKESITPAAAKCIKDRYSAQ
jgi:hypothetical protein